jgi:hypothetical protein
MEDNGKTATSIIAEISCPDAPYLVGGPGLMTMDDQRGGLVEILNMGPEPITITRGQKVGQADNVANQSLVPFEAEVINRIAEEQWKNKQGSVMKPRSRKNFDKCAGWKYPIDTRLTIVNSWPNIEVYSASTKTRSVTATPSFTNYS